MRYGRYVNIGHIEFVPVLSIPMCNRMVPVWDLVSRQQTLIVYDEYAFCWLLQREDNINDSYVSIPTYFLQICATKARKLDINATSRFIDQKFNSLPSLSGLYLIYAHRYSLLGIILDMACAISILGWYEFDSWYLK